MPNVIDLAEHRDKKRKVKDACSHFVNVLALCLSCFGRWIGRVRLGVNFFTLECPHCHDRDSFVAVLPDDMTINEVPPNGP